MKGLLKELIDWVAGIFFLLFIMYILPVILLAKLLNTTPPIKDSRFGDALDTSKTLLLATAIYFVFYLGASSIF